MNKNTIIHSAVTGMIAMSALIGSMQASAANESKGKYAGGIKAGMNDCAISMNACHDHVEVVSHKEAWIYVSKGGCEKIAGDDFMNHA